METYETRRVDGNVKPSTVGSTGSVLWFTSIVVPVCAEMRMGSPKGLRQEIPEPKYSTLARPGQAEGFMVLLSITSQRVAKDGIDRLGPRRKMLWLVHVVTSWACWVRLGWGGVGCWTGG